MRANAYGVYNRCINIALADVPERKTDLVAGVYELDAPDGPTTVAVKMTDMLGEEVLKVLGTSSGNTSLLPLQ